MSNLNLARKWRPKTFNEIVGQDLSISMLKNSLYLKKLFPVYLFSGQRGCGKTSTARLFASAINCEKLTDFQTDAKNNSVPCLQCESCKSMLEGHHPDFIEMDAASHTGVDSVRQITESCSYMPLSGSKKIYLIDEAHMLSRAAFNAFLKILEEPPASALFILATTEIQKIPDTVRSRCFQVLFNPVEKEELGRHLHNVCHGEGIKVDDDALALLVQETEGSVRDALNALEQVRFTGEQITKNIVLKSLGKISETQLFTIIDLALDQNAKSLLEHLNAIQFESLSATNIWNMIVQFLRSLLWVSYDVKMTASSYCNDTQAMKKLIPKCSLNKLHALLQLFWSQESLFLQTPQKHLFLETVLLQMCQQVNIDDIKDLLEYCKTNHTSAQTHRTHATTSLKPQTTATTQTLKTHPSTHTQENQSRNAQPAPQALTAWSTFIAKLTESCSDPMTLSIFKQACFISLNESKSRITLQLANNSIFVTDKLTEAENIWKPILIEILPTFESFDFTKKKSLQSITIQPQTLETKKLSNPQPKPTSYNYKPFQHSAKSGLGPTIDTSDTIKWPKATLLTKHFSGRIEKVTDNK